MILDYAGNPHDLFTPEVGTSKPHSGSQPVQVFCPDCGFANIFWGKCTESGEIIEHYGRRCQGWFEDDQGARAQCDYRFRFKSCPHCGAENDIAARRCHQCQAVLVDPDDMLKAALKLKDALVLRCGGMQLETGQDAKGEWLKATYYDEDGTNTSERFRLTTPAQRMAFEQIFLRPHQRAPGIALNGTPPLILSRSRRCYVIRILWSPAVGGSGGKSGRRYLITRGVFGGPMPLPEPHLTRDIRSFICCLSDISLECRPLYSGFTQPSRVSNLLLGRL